MAQKYEKVAETYEWLWQDMFTVFIVVMWATSSYGFPASCTLVTFLGSGLQELGFAQPWLDELLYIDFLHPVLASATVILTGILWIKLSFSTPVIDGSIVSFYDM